MGSVFPWVPRTGLALSQAEVQESSTEAVGWNIELRRGGIVWSCRAGFKEC